MIHIPHRPLNMGAAYRQLMLDERHYVEPEPVPDPRPNVPDRLRVRDHTPGRLTNPGPRTDNIIQMTRKPRFERPRAPRCKSWSAK